MKDRLLLLLAYLLSYLPRPLPVGKTQFESFVDRIISLTGEFADRDSMAFAIATQVMHLGPQKSCVADQFFIRSLRKAAANQVAGSVFQEIKVKQQEAMRLASERVANGEQKG